MVVVLAAKRLLGLLYMGAAEVELEVIVELL
jgi:hypothetical protein